MGLTLGLGWISRSASILRPAYWAKRTVPFPLRRVKPKCRRAVKSQAMFWVVVTLVFLNSMVRIFLCTPNYDCKVLATEHFGQPDWLSEFQEATNFFFVVLFTFEMLFKMYALGLSFYFIPLFNRFDFFVVITSILEMTLTMANVIPPLGMSVLRCIRLLRAFKVSRAVSQLFQPRIAGDPVLEIPAEPAQVSHLLNWGNRLPACSPLSLPWHLCSARHPGWESKAPTW